MKVELVLLHHLRGNPLASKTYEACEAGLAAAGHVVRTVKGPSWSARWLVVWGLGHPSAQRLLIEAKKRGVRVIGWDLGYWNREGDAAEYRVSVDHAHPHEIVMRRRRNGSRWRAAGIELRSDHDPGGPIIIAGIGRKSSATYGEHVGEWERRATEEVLAKYDGPIHYRPRPGSRNCVTVASLPVRDGPVAEVLRGAALVVCRHSNIAVDAIIAGVPVIAQEGAASAVCHTRIDGVRPPPLSEAARLAFLENLAWFQHSRAEMRQPATWHTISGMIEERT